MYSSYIKRFLDFLFSLCTIIALSPVLFITAILVRIMLGSPVLFKQDRPGLHGKIFGMYKFRSMLPPMTRDGRILTDNERLECIKNGIEVLSDDERLTKFGRLLRATSLDELPELLNILKGDMSFVGPRPLATIYLPYYNEKEMHRHDVRPGLTGLAQVNGRNSASWAKRFEYDLEYVRNVTLLNDMKIIFKTVAVVFIREGIAQGAERPESFNVVRQREWDEQKRTNNI